MTDLTQKLPYCLPNDISVENFLNNYWQKKPLLIKNGLPALVGMFEPDDVLDLALEEDVSARLISQNDNDLNQWSLKQSPLTDQDLKNTPKYWTILIQNLEQWSPELGELWQAFDFIPKWQQDDIMVSVAPKGGSVGKHYDEYDVFLAQGYGSRRWQLGKMCDLDTPFVKNQPIRLLNDMGELIFDEILEPGDVLYVPPKLSHYGVANDDCLTFSFGFRRPNMVQILDEIADIATHHKALFSPLTLPQSAQTSPYQLTGASIEAIKSALIQTLNSDIGNDIIKTALAELTSRRQYELLAFEDEADAHTIKSRLADGECLAINPASRFIMVDGDWYINGDMVCFDVEAQAVFEQLIGGHILAFDYVSDALLPVLTAWLNDGWIIFY